MIGADSRAMKRPARITMARKPKPRRWLTPAFLWAVAGVIYARLS